MARSFPNVTSDTVAPFADQFSTGSLSDAQVAFFANNYYGAQKQYSTQIARYRAVNPNFLLLHYRLAQEAGPAPAIAHDSNSDGSVNGNVFSSEEWTSFAQNQDWYIIGTDGQRVRNSQWNWYPFDLLRSTELRNQLADYWSNRVTLEVNATNSDGVFADSAGQLIPPYDNSAALPNYFPSSPNFDLTSARNFLSNGYAPYSQRIWANLQSQNVTYLPNLGQMITGWDNINNYLNSDGGMVEGFTGFGTSITDLGDWKLQQNNMLALVRNNKIVIAQADFDTMNDYTRRSFIIGSYLLARGQKSFINMYSGGIDQWYPEYDLDMGSYTGVIPNSVDDLLWNGVYRRNYQNGMVLVNPSAASVIVNLGANYNQAIFTGGGNLPLDAARPGSISYTQVSQVTVPARGAVFLLTIANQPVDADSDGYNSTVDCNDNNANVNPGKVEIQGNGIDDDCNANTLDSIPVAVTGLIATIGIDSSEAYIATTASSPGGQTRWVINDTQVQGLGTQLAANQGLYVYTPKRNGQAYYLVTDSNNNSIPFQMFERNGQVFITWTETASQTYNIFRTEVSTAGYIQITETNNPIQPVLIWQQGGARLFTLFMPQDAWDMVTFRGQGYNFYVGTPNGYNFNSPTPLSLTLHVEGWGSRYVIENPSIQGTGGSPYNVNTIFIRADEPMATPSWYFGHYCDSNNQSKGVCNFVQNAMLEAALSIARRNDYNVDMNRIYAYGHSMGGTGVISLGIYFPQIFAGIYASEPVTDPERTGSLGGTDWMGDFTSHWGARNANLQFHPVGVSKQYLQQFDGQNIWTFYNKSNFVCANQGRDTALITLAHGTADDVVDTDTQGYPFYLAANNCKVGFQAQITSAGHSWQAFAGIGQNLDIFGNFNYRKESFPALSNAQNSKNPATTGAGQFNQDLRWAQVQDTAQSWQMQITSTSSDQRVDVTPRRSQLAPQPNQQFTWERKNTGGAVLETGQVQANQYGVVTVPQVLVTTSGNIIALTPGQVGPDVTPPVISSLSAAPSQTTATISFNTNEATNATIEYGLNTAYGTTQNKTSATTHSFTLTALSSNTTYYYRVNATDAAGNKATQTNTFTTQVIPIDADGDGFFQNIAPLDCNDNNAAINPNKTEIIANGLDDDCNANTSDSAFDSATAVNLAGGLPAGYEPSGIVWHPYYNSLFLVSDGGILSRMTINGSNVTNWNVAGDLEGVTITNSTDPYVYIAVEYPFAVIQFNPQTGQIIRTVSLTGIIPAVVNTNSGIEAITFVPNGRHPYANSANGGLFYIGVQETGAIHAVDINFNTSNATLIASFTPVAGRGDIAGLDFGIQTNALSVLYDSADKLREIYVNNTLRVEYAAAGLNQEGISIITNCPSKLATAIIAEDSGRVMKYVNYPVTCAPIDADFDGYDVNNDCDDNNALINPGRSEVIGNGINDDCNANTSDNPVVNQTNQTISGTFNLNLTKDTYLFEAYSNQGANQILKMYKEAGSNGSRILIQFNTTLVSNQLNALNASLVYAKLKLYHIAQFFETSTRGATTYALTRNWNEGNGQHEHDWPATGANWTNTGSTNWTTPGGDYNAQVLSITNIPNSTGWIYFDITNNSVNTNGYLIDVTGDWRQDDFASKENTNTSIRPALEIGYAFNTPADTTAPNVSNLVITTNESNATLTFTTNENATSNLQYNASKPNATTPLGTSHSVTLTQLLPQTTYNYTLKVTDTSNNTRVYSGQFTTPDLTPPTISNKILTIHETNASIALNTNEQTTTVLSYGLTQAYGTNLVQNGATFNFQLTNLTAQTLYYYKINATDTSKNSRVQLGNFTTIDITPPIITTSSAPNGTTATITVTTNENSTVTITIPSIAVTQTSSNGTAHTFSATGLTEQTLYTYVATATDAFGNQASKIANFTTLDLTPPVINLTNTPSGNYNALTITTNEVATIDVVLAGSQINLLNTNGLTKTYNLSGLNEQTNYAVQVSATDTSGNTATQITQFTTLDTTPAQITNTQVNPDGNYATVTINTNEPAAITLTRQDAGNVEVIATTPTSATFNLTNLQEQTTYHYEVLLLDTSNNPSNFQNSLTTLDKTAPIITITENVLEQNAQITINTNEEATIQLTSPDMQIEQVQITPTSATFNLTNLTALTRYTFQVTATDVNGNTAQVNDEFTTLDLTSPTITAVNNPSGTHNLLQITTNENSTIQVQIANAQVELSSTNGLNHVYNITGLQEQTQYTVQIIATDSSGNTATSSTEFITLDQTPPQITIANTPSGNYNIVTINTNEQTTVQLTVQNATVTQLNSNGTTHTFNVTNLLEQTTYEEQITATDSSENTATISSQFTTLDLTPPVITIQQVTPLEQSALIEITTSENAIITLNANNAQVTQINSSPTSATFNLTNLTQLTQYEYEVIAQDQNNNTATINSALTTLDLTLPEVLTTSTPSGTYAVMTVNTNENTSVTIESQRGEVTLISTNGLTHIYNITNLIEQTTYNVQIIATDASGNAAISSTEFTTLDQTAPSIQLQLTNDKLNYVLTATTNENANVQVQIENAQVTQTSSNGIAHTFSITGLTEQTSYNVQITATDNSNNQATAATQFTTSDYTAPETTSIEFSPIEQILNIYLTENATATITINNVELNSINAQNHTFNLSELTQGTYEYTLILTDSSGNSKEQNEQLTVPDKTPPVISNTNIQVNETNAVITLETNEDATVTLQYENNEGAQTLNSNGTTHTFSLTNLNQLTQYNYTIAATDQAQNTISIKDEFTTSDQTAPQVTNTIFDPATQTLNIQLNENANAALEIQNQTILSQTNTSHTFNLSQFPDGNLNYQLTLTDSSGNTNQINAQVTNPDRTTPQVTQLQITHAINLTTINLGATEQVNTTLTILNTNQETIAQFTSTEQNNTFNAPGLIPNTAYVYELTLVDQAGLQNRQGGNFTTPKLSDLTLDITGDPYENEIRALIDSGCIALNGTNYDPNGNLTTPVEIKAITCLFKLKAPQDAQIPQLCNTQDADYNNAMNLANYLKVTKYTNCPNTLGKRSIAVSILEATRAFYKTSPENYAAFLQAIHFSDEQDYYYAAYYGITSAYYYFAKHANALPGIQNYSNERSSAYGTKVMTRSEFANMLIQVMQYKQ